MKKRLLSLLLCVIFITGMVPTSAFAEDLPADDGGLTQPVTPEGPETPEEPETLEGPTTPEEPITPEESYTLELSADAEELYPGDTAVLTAHKVIAGESVAYDKVLWAVDDESIGTVSELGVFTALSAGTVTVSATDMSDAAISAQLSITVTEPEETYTLSIEGETELETGGTTALTAYKVIAGKRVAYDNVLWSVSDENVGTVSEFGVFTALAAGTATVTATDLSDAAVSTRHLITVTSLRRSASRSLLGGSNATTTSVTVTGANGATSVASGDTLQMSAVYSEDPAATFRWSVSTTVTGSTTIDTDGLLIAYKADTVTVTATVDDGSGTGPSGSADITITQGDFAFTVANGEATITGYNGPVSGSLSIPDTLAGCTVTAIEGNVFSGRTGFTSLTLPSGLVTIGESAFYGCTGLTGSLSIPNSVTSIGESAFAGCTGFTGTLTLPTNDGFTEVSNGAFSGCGFTGALIIPANVTTIGGGAFHECEGFDSAVALPPDVGSIGANAFDGSSIAAYRFFGNVPRTEPSNVIYRSLPTDATVYYSMGKTGWTVADGKWQGYNATLITVEITGADSTKLGVDQTYTGRHTGPDAPAVQAYTWSVTDGTGSATIDGATGELVPMAVGTVTVRATAADGVYGEKTVTIAGSDYRYIDDPNTGGIALTAYNGPMGAIDIVMPTSIAGVTVTTIGSSLFDNQNGTRVITGTLTLPAKLQIIGNYAFRDAKFTGALALPSTLTTIYNYVFTSTGFSGALNIPSGVTVIGMGAFRGCVNLTGDLVLPANLVTLSESAFRDCTGLTSLTLPTSASFTRIENHAFNGCTSLAGQLTLPDSLKYIGNGAFDKCKLSGALVIPEHVEVIGSSAFSGLFDGTSNAFTGDLVIPDSVTEIRESAFYACGFTGALRIGAGLTVIPSNVFAACGFTGTLTIPANITEISSNAFAVCRGFTGDLSIPNTVRTLGVNAFTSCSGLNGTLTIGTGIAAIPESAFDDCGFTGALTIPSNITSIGRYAFYRCTGFDSAVVLPAGVDSIGENAFNLSSIATYRFLGNAPTTIIPNVVGRSMPENATVYYPAGNSFWTVTDGKWQGYTASTYADCTVSFDGNGATGGGAPGNVQVLTGDSMPALSAVQLPTREHTVSYTYNGATGGSGTTGDNAVFTFAGYYDGTTGGKQYYTAAGASAAAWDKTEDATLYAGWSGGSVTLPTPARTGYTFAGWYSDSTLQTRVGGGGASYTPSGNVTLYAKWTLNKYSVSYASAHGTITGSTDADYLTAYADTLVPDTGYARPTAITVTMGGAVFTDFSYNAATGAVSIEAGKILGNIVISGACTPISYSITYTGMTGASYGTKHPTSHTYDTATQVSDPTKTGYSFDGWKVNGGTATKDLTLAADGYTADITLEATWTANTYTVSYNGNGSDGGATADSAHTYDTASALTLNGFTKTGYTFSCWNTTADGSGDAYADGEDVTNLATSGTFALFATWMANTYTVTLDWQSATVPGPASVSATYGSALPAMTSLPQRSYTVTYSYNGADGDNASPGADADYDFLGYFDAIDGGEQYYTAMGQSARAWDKAEAATLYAHWTSASVTLPTPTRTGYSFAGWYSDSTLQTRVGDGGASYTPTADTTLYAKWIIKTYAVTLPATQTGYTLAAKSGSASPVNHGGSYTFTFALDAAYSASTPTVMVNGVPVTLTNGEYTITNITAVQTVTVEGVTRNNTLSFTPEQLDGATAVEIDGVTYALTNNSVVLPDGTSKVAVLITEENAGDADAHKRYPNSMKVFILRFDAVTKTYTPERVGAFDDLLRYAGCSIRLTGSYGIRMITGMDEANRSALINGDGGWTLIETGTVVAWANTNDEPTIGGTGCVSNFAYKSGAADPVFKRSGGIIQYTNVLVNDFTHEQCIKDFALRPYAVFQNASGDEIIVYGGVVQRSIWYVAKQNEGRYSGAAGEFIDRIIAMQ